MTTPVFLLAAGLGTRLRPLTDARPKPLLPVGDRPALAHILDRVSPLGGKVVVNAHHRADDLRAFFEGYAPDARVSVEPEILGTAGGLANARAMLGEGHALVWNGDILSELDPARLLDAHAAHPDAEATLAFQALPAGEGNIGTDEEHRVVRLRAETVFPGEVRGGLFLGIHVVSATLRDRLPTRGCLVGDVYLPALRRVATLHAFDVGDTRWEDIGTLLDYQRANLAWLERRGEGSFLGRGATVGAGVKLERSVVGAGASVWGEGDVVRSVVWPGVSVEAPLVDAIATPGGLVAVGPDRP